MIQLLQKFKSELMTIFVTILGFVAPIQYILLAVGFMIFADTITGVWKAIKNKVKITSYKLSQVITKMLIYQSVILLVFGLEIVILDEFIKLFIDIPHFLTKIVAIVLISVECKSIHENIEAITNINLFNKGKELLQNIKKAKADINELKN